MIDTVKYTIDIRTRGPGGPWPYKIYKIQFGPHYLPASYIESIKNNAGIIGRVQNQAI